MESMTMFGRILEKDPREEKLPEWAKGKLANLRSAVQSYATQLDDLKTGTKQSPFWVEAWDSNARFYLPRSAGMLSFGTAERWTLQMLPETDPRLMTIRAHHGPLIIRPAASNSISLAEGEW